MIEILNTNLIADEDKQFWAVWLQITNDVESWMLPTSAPSALADEELQVYFDAQEDELWRVAQIKQYAPDIFQHIPLKQLLEAFALVVLDEVNILRARAELSERAANQIVSAIRDKLK